MTDASTRAMLSGVRNEDGLHGGFLHLTEPSSRHFLTHRRIAFGDGAFCWFRSRLNQRWGSVIDPVRINSSTAHTRSLTPQRSKLTKYEGHCLCQNTWISRHPSGEARNKNFKMLHYFCRTMYICFLTDPWLLPKSSHTLRHPTLV